MKTIKTAFILISLWLLSILFIFIGFAIITFIIANMCSLSYVGILQTGVPIVMFISCIIAFIILYYYVKEISPDWNLAIVT